MNIRVLVSVVGLALAGAGCATTAPPLSAFAFEHEGVSYQIVTDRAALEPVNDLVRQDGRRTVLRARDRDQDGLIDTLLTGSISLERANEIYAHGIDIARSRGQFRFREPARMYTLADRGGELTVWSIAKGGSDWINRLVRYAPGNRIVYDHTDTDADGRLDDEAGAVPRAQHDYERILEAGQRDGHIEVVGSRLRVRLSAAPNS